MRKSQQRMVKLKQKNKQANKQTAVFWRWDEEHMGSQASVTQGISGEIPDRLSKLLFIEVWLLHNVVLLSTIRQNESAVVHVYPLFAFFAFSFRSPRGAEQRSPQCAIGSPQLSVLFIISVKNMGQSQSPSPFPALSPLVSLDDF